MPRRGVTLHNILKDKDHTIGAEIGCFKGATTKYLLDRLDIKLLYCIDPGVRYEDFENVIYNKKTKQMDFEKDGYQVFLKNVQEHKDKIKILKMFSKEAAKHVQDNLLDFVFIDGNHAYEYVKEDIQLGRPKVKKGGLISGHDYDKEGKLPNFGVTQAVNEEFGRDNIKVDNSIWYIEKG